MTNREVFFCIAFLFAWIAAAVWAGYTKYRTRKIMEHMARMIDAAAKGIFREEVYDESMLSALEQKLAGYLAASDMSVRNMEVEKEKIKELIADISHQTKMPVANIVLYTQLLSEQEQSEESRECIAELNRQAEKLNFLIGALVKISRLETGVFSLHQTVGSVSSLIEGVIAQIAPTAEEKKIRIEFTPQEVYACFDKKWTAEAIYNIVDNAVKYTPEGGIISIDFLEMELFVRIGIKDTGIGISEEETAKIFGRFYRSPLADSQEGVGIGLFLAREIIAKESGYIKVESEIGEGSIFYVYLPAVSKNI